MPEEKGLAFRVLVRISEFNHPKSCPCKGYKGSTESFVPPEHRCKEAAFLRREVSLLNPGVISGAKRCRTVLSCSQDKPTPRALREHANALHQRGKSQRRTHDAPQAQRKAKQAPASPALREHSTPRPNTRCPTRCPLFPGKPGGPILPGTPGCPFVGKKRDREGLLGGCNTTPPASHEGSQLLRNPAG